MPFKGIVSKFLSASSYNTNIDTLKNYTKRFEEEFPEIPAYLQYTDPDFKIRVGNFRTRIEAIPTLKRIRKKYAGAYPVKTIIYLNELNPVQEQDTITSPANTGNFNFRFTISDHLPASGKHSKQDFLPQIIPQKWATQLQKNPIAWK